MTLQQGKHNSYWVSNSVTIFFDRIFSSLDGADFTLDIYEIWWNYFVSVY